MPVCSRVALASAVGALAWSSAFAGPLDPPSGPIASTPGPEPRIAINPTNTPGDVDSVFKITQPGSYYLTGNVSGQVGKHGIQIAASGVTLDLNGFELRGVPKSLDGINVSAVRGRNIAICNGSLRSWGDCGLECEFIGGNPPAVTLVGLQAALNARHGLALETWSRVESCLATENAGTGIYSGGNCTIIHCLSGNNAVDGFVGNRGTTIIGCTANGNTGRGFYTAIGSLLRECVSDGDGTGFVSQGTAFESCVAHDSVGIGFDLFTGCTLTACSAYRSGNTGIDASSNASVTGCTANECAGAGIVTGTGTLVINCTVNENAGNGITLGSGASATGCSVVNNLGLGITASSNATIRANDVINNGGTTATNANIRVIGSDTRVEGNNVADAPIGVQVAAAGNIIIGNTATGNSLNWDVVAGNACLVVLGVNAGAISGDSGGVSPGSSNPFANFTY